MVRAGKHQRIDLGDKGIHKEKLTPPASTGGVELYRAVIEPGGSTGDALFFTYKGEQVGYVIEGQLELFIQDRLYRLRRWRQLLLRRRDAAPVAQSRPSITTVIWAITGMPK